MTTLPKSVPLCTCTNCKNSDSPKEKVLTLKWDNHNVPYYTLISCMKGDDLDRNACCSTAEIKFSMYVPDDKQPFNTCEHCAASLLEYYSDMRYLNKETFTSVCDEDSPELRLCKCETCITGKMRKRSLFLYFAGVTPRMIMLDTCAGAYETEEKIKCVAEGCENILRDVWALKVQGNKFQYLCSQHVADYLEYICNKDMNYVARLGNVAWVFNNRWMLVVLPLLGALGVAVAAMFR